MWVAGGWEAHSTHPLHPPTFFFSQSFLVSFAAPWCAVGGREETRRVIMSARSGSLGLPPPSTSRNSPTLLTAPCPVPHAALAEKPHWPALARLSSGLGSLLAYWGGVCGGVGKFPLKDVKLGLHRTLKDLLCQDCAWSRGPRAPAL